MIKKIILFLLISSISTVPVFVSGQDKGKKAMKPQVDQVKKELTKLNKLKTRTGTSTKPVSVVIGQIISVILQVIGTVALIMFIYGGLLIMTSEGKSDRYLQGMKTMLWAALGTVAIFASYALVSFVMQGFTT